MTESEEKPTEITEPINIVDSEMEASTETQAESDGDTVIEMEVNSEENTDN